MGVVENIRIDRRPQQSENVGAEVEVYFHYDLEHSIHGTIIRDDLEMPGERLIMLDDGFVVRGTECQHALRGNLTPCRPGPSSPASGSRS